MDIIGTIQAGWRDFAEYISLNPVLGPIFGALITSSALLLIPVLFTARFSRINATLDFSKRFHASVLNKDFATAHRGEDRPSPNADEIEYAHIWWWRFFDLLLYEYDFHRHRQIDDIRFREWMRWRWYDFNGWDDHVWKTCGVSYAEGWQFWKNQPPVSGNPLVAFLDDVHAARDAKAADRRIRAYSTPLGRASLRASKRLFGRIVLI